DPKGDALNALIVQGSDLAAGGLVMKDADWNNFTSTPTLDLCNGTYPSESTRTARRQVRTVGDNGDPGLSTEAVLYETPANAAAAFADMEKVVATCPKSVVTSPVGEVPAQTVFRARPDAAWPATPGVTRLAYDFTTTTSAGTVRSIAVYLRRG